jgi:hypothetical protein
MNPPDTPDDYSKVDKSFQCFSDSHRKLELLRQCYGIGDVYGRKLRD